MTKLFYTTTAFLGLMSAAAWASPFSDQVVVGLQAQGFERIEIAEGPTQLKVEAIRGSTKVEIIYDLATGAVLKQETETVDVNEDTTPGIEIDTEEEDFLDVGEDDDNDDDAVEDESGGSDDDMDDVDDESEADDDSVDDSGHDGVGQDDMNDDDGSSDDANDDSDDNSDDNSDDDSGHDDSGDDSGDDDTGADD